MTGKSQFSRSKSKSINNPNAKRVSIFSPTAKRSNTSKNKDQVYTWDKSKDRVVPDFDKQYFFGYSWLLAFLYLALYGTVYGITYNSRPAEGFALYFLVLALVVVLGIIVFVMYVSFKQDELFLSRGFAWTWLLLCVGLLALPIYYGVVHGIENSDKDKQNKQN